VSIEGKVTGGYPNRTVFLGLNLAMRTREKRMDINPIVWNAKRAELYDNLSMHHSALRFTRALKNILRDLAR
jgi:hypothetical protein